MLVLALGAWAQVDTEFWFAAPALSPKHKAEQITLNIVTCDRPANVTVSLPAAGRTLMSNKAVAAHSVYTLPLGSIFEGQPSAYLNDIATPADGLVHPRGILISSTVPVSAYFTTANDNAEIYTLKGSHGLGTDFVVPMQNRYRCGLLNSEDPRTDQAYAIHTDMMAHASVEVVATEDDTHVQIVTHVPTNVDAAASTIRVTLNKGESYAVQSRQTDTPAALLLGGTRVTADKPVAVNSTDDSATDFTMNNWGDKDLVGEQLVPSDLAGDRYVVVANNSADNRHEYAYFYAIDAPAEIYTTDGTTETLVGTVSGHQPLEVKLNNLSANYFYTRDATPFVCFQLTSNDEGRELGGTILPSLSCSGSTEVAYVPVLAFVGNSAPTVTIHVSVLTRMDCIDSFLVNGSPLDLPKESFSPVPGMDQWAYAADVAVTIPVSMPWVQVRNSKGVFHLAILDSGGGAFSYGYFSNFGKLTVGVKTDHDYYFTGEDIYFSLREPDIYSEIHWSGPRGEFGLNDPAPVITDLTDADNGQYIVWGTHKDGCEMIPDTFTINVLSASPVHRMAVCKGDSAVITADGVAPFTWYKDGVPMTHTERTYGEPLETDATYVIEQFVEGLDVIGWTGPDTFALHAADSTILWMAGYEHIAQGLDYDLYYRFSAPQANAAPPRITVSVNNSSTGIIAVPNPPAGAEGTFRWNADSDYALIRITVQSPKEGRTVTIDSIAFVPRLPLTETVYVTVQEDFQPQIKGDSLLCDGAVRLRTEMEYDAYLWSTGDTTRSIEVASPGVYTVTVRSGNCTGTNRITVKANTPAVFAIDDPAEICGGKELSVPATVVSGEMAEWQLYLNGAMIAKGTGLPVAGDMAETLPAGKYNGCVRFTDSPCGRVTEMPYQLTVNLSTDIFAQRWNDILAVKNTLNNGGLVVSSYEWYRNGVAMNEHRSYIYVEEEFAPGDSYTVLLTLADGTQLWSCPYTPVHIDYEGDGLESVYTSSGMPVQQVRSPGLYIVLKNGIATKVIRR